MEHNPTRAADAQERALADLRERGERVTPARRALVEVLAGTLEHLGAEEIAERVGRRAAELGEAAPSRATVYRALATLSELGVVRHTHLPGASTVYHLASGEEHHEHAHLQCARCGRVIDVPTAVLAPLVKELDEDWGFTLDPAHAALLGTCTRCRDV